jgi:hypothetical protein
MDARMNDEMMLDEWDWAKIAGALDAYGWARLPALLSEERCDELVDLYRDETRFRKQVIMGRHAYGRGQYRYFAYPLPPLVVQLRAGLYRRLLPIANCWNDRMGIAQIFPDDHAAFIDRCHASGQSRPTPLLLKYGPDDYNCLHQDLYGEHVFPLQAAILLSAPGDDFEGGDFILTEQRPRMQSRAEVVPLAKGDAVIFAVHNRPVAGTRGSYRVNMRHGVGTVRSGRRYTMGIIFHDAA